MLLKFVKTNYFMFIFVISEIFIFRYHSVIPSSTYDWFCIIIMPFLLLGGGWADY